MKALYRRYRPTSLDEVVGQDQVIAPLKKSLDTGKISHAYIFTGPRGTGKTSVARIFAHELNDFEYEVEDDYIDIIEIDGASNRGIDSVRELREKAIVAPSQGKYKIYIIDEFHMFTTDAFNALLKTLEEPPEHVVFILATTDLHKVPTTIISRSQVYRFQLANQKIMTDFLRKVCKKEEINIDDGALELLYKHGGGSFRDTLSLLDQISTLDHDKITANTIIAALGLADQEQVDRLLQAYNNQNLNEIQEELKEVLRNNTAINTVVNSLIETIIQSPQPQQLGLLKDLVDITKGTTTYPEVALLVALTKPLSNAPIVKIQQTVAPTAKTTAPQAEEEPTKASEISAQEKPAVIKSTDAKSIQQEIILKAQEELPAIVKTLEDSVFSLDDSVLTIYTNNDFYKKRLERKRSFILERLPEEYQLNISNQLPSSSNIDNIKSMMGGGEVVKL